MQNDYQEALQHTLSLLKQEWAADLALYKTKFLSSSIAEKKEAGICWYPVQVRTSSFTLADRVLIEVERFDQLEHDFQSGKSVSVFTFAPQGAKGNVSLNGVINYVRKDKMAITLNVDELPQWLLHEKIGVDLLFDEASYRHMESAMRRVIKAKGDRTAELKEVLLGTRAARFSQQVTLIAPNRPLNPSQESACQLIQQAEDVALVHGPPGTGKTSTLVQAILTASYTYPQVLVCAPSNAAVDLLTERLGEVGLEVLRLGHPARIDAPILASTLDARIAAHDSYKELKLLRKKAEALRKQAGKYKRNFGAAERAARNHALQEARMLKENARHLEDYIHYDVFQRAQVITCTLVGAASAQLDGHRFPLVFIDEAAQGLEPATWIPLLRADRVVMAGDHCQLPPTIKSFEAGRAGLSQTLFEKVILRQAEAAVMLEVQYRMPEVIMRFSAQTFYEGKLQAAPITDTHRLHPDEPILEFIDTAGTGFLEHKEKDSLSTLNEREAVALLRYLEQCVKRLGIGHMKQEGWNIGLIAPYSAQVRALRQHIFETFQFPNLKAFSELLTVNSIDGFQGQERDIMAISLVRANETGEMGFLSDTRRMNVALTRAKRKLIVMGDSATLSHHPFYADFIDYVDRYGTYSSIYTLPELLEGL